MPQLGGFNLLTAYDESHLERSWIKQKTCWTLIHQRCNRPHEILTNLSALCLIVKGSFVARTAHSCGSDWSVTVAHRCLGGSGCASRLPLARRASDYAAGYYVGVLLPLGQAARSLKLGPFADCLPENVFLCASAVQSTYKSIQ